jgi:predicted nucleic acid-binding protein
MPALLDTSAVLAAVDRADASHAEVVAALAAERSTLILPNVALPEISHLLDVRHGSSKAAAVMDRLVRGAWPVTCLEQGDMERATELMTRYADARIGFVDAAIAALAERVGAVRIYTLDRRDFAVLRPRHVAAFDVMPSV